MQRAIAARTVKLLFEESTLKLDPTCNILVTLCSEYAAGRFCAFISWSRKSFHTEFHDYCTFSGRTELPNNLKTNFRKVAMLLPDIRGICEMSLFASGFSNAMQLSRMMSAFHVLCSEQLSYQHHYEFGIRSAKCALAAAGMLRRTNKHLTEEQVVLKSLTDLHISKLHDNDINCFKNICSELFPDTELPSTDTEYIEKYIRARCEKRKIQATPWFLHKIHQLYQMLCVKHGVMLVGGTMSGKTTAWQILAETLKEVKNDEKAKVKEYDVSCRVINPKSVSTAYLFGDFDAETGDWMDGVLAKTFREMATSTLETRSWIIFDGCVDPLWVEKLNTLLDDNKKLCLISGEIIEKSQLQTILFETVDLEQASPATVSRCGFVFMNQHQLGWEVIHKSFLIDLETLGLNEIYMSLFETLVDWLIPAIIDALIGTNGILSVTPMYQYKVIIVQCDNFLGSQFKSRCSFHFVSDVQCIFHAFSNEAKAIQSGLVPANLFILHGMGICIYFEW